MIDKNNNNESNLEREEGWKTYQSKSCVYNNKIKTLICLMIDKNNNNPAF